MPDRALTESHSDRLSVRQLKTLVVVLILSNLALGGFGFYCLRGLDRKYSSLIDQTVPVLSELQTLTAGSMEAMRETNPVAWGNAAGTQADKAGRARAAIERDREMRSSALKREWLSANAGERENFQKAGDAFSEGAEKIVALLESSQDAEGGRQREESLRPIFDRYVAATGKATDVVEAQSLRANNTLSARTGNISKVMLGVAGWPVMVLGIFLLVTAVFVVVMLLKALFSKQEAI